ncbi:hypothetical protein [Chryseobacterium sp. MEBOG07]|uniref:hypothetical protein n=1 Tax=Chryseobacterium sp. MEBOG07 TaxID=2879939 RepID=UPI001F354AC7|nr:hypothetical protein [Chryseobacterium sp. MEBOG07]UKB78608.1 hypothetical protein LF886_19390 [Chryseobacterium sp. MEBOG07]
MKIELKNIHFSQQLSEESNAFSANLYIEGVKAGSVSNRGRGGPTVCKAVDERGDQLIIAAENYCHSLPSEKSGLGSEQYELKMDLGRYVDKLLVKYLQEKENQKFQKKLETAIERGIVVGIPGKSFEVWEFTQPIGILLQHPKGPDMIKRALKEDIISELTGGKIIMNTNIPQKLLEEAGLKKSQYAGPVSDESTIKQKVNKQQRKGPKL